MTHCKEMHPFENTTEDRDLLEDLVNSLCATYEDGIGVNNMESSNLPHEAEILELLNILLELIFPGFLGRKAGSSALIRYTTGDLLVRAHEKLTDILTRTYRYTCRNANSDCDCHEKANAVTHDFLTELPAIRTVMKEDVQAAYEGDPAARNTDEIIMSYPGLKAITIHRIAHGLFTRKVNLIPRMMNEYAHRITGIDIHPGASIGRGFFIDHGTGVVIGETASLGNHVKMYQGVTLGALSFPKDGCGMIIKGAKRHPTIEDNVTIYAGATILGPIVIGEGAVIGGNVWITEPVPPHTRVFYTAPEQIVKPGRQTRP